MGSEMREIKFRVWLEIKREMVYFSLQEILVGINLIQADGKLYALEEKPIMQFTGLTALSDEKIFEGDIVEDDNEEVFEVYWSSHAWFSFRNVKTGVPLQEKYMQPIMKVIGNIYENPELLK